MNRKLTNREEYDLIHPILPEGSHFAFFQHTGTIVSQKYIHIYHIYITYTHIQTVMSPSPPWDNAKRNLRNFAGKF